MFVDAESFTARPFFKDGACSQVAASVMVSAELAAGLNLGMAAAGPLAAKTRYRQADAPCLLHDVSASDFGLTFAEPQWAVTPGQSAVLYDGEVCLGGGVIHAACA